MLIRAIIIIALAMLESFLFKGDNNANRRFATKARFF